MEIASWPTIYSRVAASAAKVSEVEQELKTVVTESEKKFEQLKRKGEAQQAEFIEEMDQAEAEFDDNTDRLKQELMSTKQAAKETEEDLKAQTHVYTRCSRHLAGKVLCCVHFHVHCYSCHDYASEVINWHQ